MKEISKKIVTIILSSVMVVAMLPISVMADIDYDIGVESIESDYPETTSFFAGGTGTEDDPYIIETKEQLNNVRNYLSASFKLNNDIVFNEEDFAEGGDFYNDGTGWQPIGADSSNAFSGTLDGNGYFIKNLFINTEIPIIGLFGYSTGIIKNIGIVDCNITGTEFAGAVVGLAFDGIISNSYNTGSIVANGRSSMVGGIVGYVEKGKINNCYNTGTISGSGFEGGIAGYITGRGTINNCYNTGMILGDGGNTGGIVGIIDSFCTISNCYNIGVTRANNQTGGIAGDSYGTISNCYYHELIDKGVRSGTDTATKCTLDEMKEKNTYEGFDFDNVWKIETNGYPLPVLRETSYVYLDNTEEFAGGNGTIVKPYLISNKEQFNTIRKYLRACYKLVSDITFSDEDFTEGGAYYNNGTGWNPIGTDFDNAFYGVFDGNEHTINNLFINTELKYVGLFGFSRGNIENLGIIDCDITNSWNSQSGYAGSVAGYNIGTIKNCYNTGIINGFNAGGIVGCGGAISIISNCYNIGTISGVMVGGIAGDNSEIISNCYNTGTISGSEVYYYCKVGGIAGEISGTISNCYNTGSVISSSSNDSYAGGIVGEGYGTISNCNNIGNISAYSSNSSYAGGIIGCVSDYETSTISNCYNTGTISESNYAGGIAGYVKYAYRGSISNCYNIGMVSGSSYAGGIAGVSDGTISNCYYLDIINKGVGSGSDETVNCSLSSMKKQDTYKKFDFENVWEIEANEYSLPTLQLVNHVNKDDNTEDFAGGNGTIVKPYLVSNKEQLNNIRNYLGACYKLVSDITFTEEDFADGGAFFNDGVGWQPIGTDSENVFYGVFDGNGYSIKNLFINTESEYAGLFGYSTGCVENLGIIDCNIAGKMYTGGIVGYEKNGTINNCYNTGTITADESHNIAGGIAGENDGKISNCYNTGSIVEKGSYGYAGGIAGFAHGTIINCHNTGVISSDHCAGGIVGDTRNTTSNCYNTGSVVANGSYGYVGGIAGSSSTISNCYNIGNITSSSSSDSFAGGIAGLSGAQIKNCYNTGTISAGNAGGIAGELYRYDTVSNCYNIGEISGSNAGGIAGEKNGIISNCYYIDIINKGAGSGVDTATKCTLAEMKDKKTYVGFDFNAVWTMKGNEDYLSPELQDVPMIFTKSLIAMSITSEPSKTQYIEGKDKLNLSGGKITLEYDNDTKEEKDITSDMVSGFDNTKVGKQTLTVTYGDFTDTFEVEIIAKSLTGIKVTTLPTSVEYLKGKKQLIVTGGKLKLTYDNDTTSEIAITSDLVSGYDDTKIGEQTLTVTYKGFTDTFNTVVTIIEGVTVSLTSLSWNNTDDTVYLIYDSTVEDKDIKADMLLDKPLLAKDYVAEKGNITLHADKKHYQQEVAFNAVEPGNYKLVIGKREKYAPIIKELNVETQNIELGEIVLLLKGDVNNDGVIGAEDVTALARHIANLSIITDENILTYCCDTNGDGIVDAADVTHLARFIANLISEL